MISCGEKLLQEYSVPARDRSKQAFFQAIPLSSSFQPLSAAAENLQKPPTGAKLTESQWEGAAPYWASFFHTEVTKRRNEADVELEQVGEEQVEQDPVPETPTAPVYSFSSLLIVEGQGREQVFF